MLSAGYYASVVGHRKARRRKRGPVFLVRRRRIIKNEKKSGRKKKQTGRIQIRSHTATTTTNIFADGGEEGAERKRKEEAQD